MSSSQSSPSTLDVPELIQEIGKYLAPRELGAAIQVCKGWQASLLPLAARDIYISYPDEILPSLDLLARNIWRTHTITIIGRPDRGPIEYFNLRGCMELKKFIWKSKENCHNRVTDRQWDAMVTFLRENRAAMESITIEYGTASWMGFWMAFSLNPIPHLTSLNLRKTAISADSVHYFWATCRHLEILELEECAGLRYLRPICRDVSGAAAVLRAKLGGGAQSLPSLDQLGPDENFMFPQMRVLKLPTYYNGDGWADLMEQCPKLEAWW